MPEPGSDAFRVWSLWLGLRVAEAGPTPVEPHVQRFCVLARRFGIEPSSTAVLADRAAGEVERSRAFFRVATVFDDVIDRWDAVPDSPDAA